MQNQTVKVRFLAQGGVAYIGTATKRIGTKLLIAYRIGDGSERERWIPGKRIIETVEGDIATLPRFVTHSCRGTKFDEPLDWNTALNQTFPPCAKCGLHHQLVYSTVEDTTSACGWHGVATGFASAQLEPVRVDA